MSTVDEFPFLLFCRYYNLGTIHRECG